MSKKNKSFSKFLANSFFIFLLPDIQNKNLKIFFFSFNLKDKDNSQKEKSLRKEITPFLIKKNFMAKVDSINLNEKLYKKSSKDLF
jgi:hypothetical protein